MKNIIFETMEEILENIEKGNIYTHEDINALDNKGSNALFYSDVNKANFLINMGIDAFVINNDERNALFFSDYLTSLTLIGFGLDFYQRDKKGLNIAEFIFHTYKNENKLMNMKEKIKLCIRLKLDLSDKIHLTDIQKKIVRECIEEIVLEESANKIIKDALNRLTS